MDFNILFFLFSIRFKIQIKNRCSHLTTMRCITVTILLPEDLWASVREALRYNHSRTPTLDTPAAVLVKWSKTPNKNREKG